MTPSSEPDELPASIRAAWGLSERPRRGPKPALSLERIVGTAAAVAASEGLAAVSMQRVAAELGSSPMGLYRYVASKDELLALMADGALGEPPAELPEDWRGGLERWARAQHDAYLRHPWALGIPAGPAVTPNLTRWLEHGLRALAATGLGEAEKLSVLLLLSGYVRNSAALGAQLAVRPGDPEAGVMPSWGRRLGLLVDAERFPALSSALASGVFAHDDPPDEEFTFGLERVLDGVEALVRAKAARAPERP
jgi:AcrR family transcriptional regulator